MVKIVPNFTKEKGLEIRLLASKSMPYLPWILESSMILTTMCRFKLEFNQTDKVEIQ